MSVANDRKRRDPGGENSTPSVVAHANSVH